MLGFYKIDASSLLHVKDPDSSYEFCATSRQKYQKSCDWYTCNVHVHSNLYKGVTVLRDHLTLAATILGSVAPKDILY